MARRILVPVPPHDDLEPLTVEPRVRFGDVASGILREADESGAELIALPARARRWWRPLRPGGVARRAARRATAPVMVLAC
jgi:nucleotide-binding universal stress UspA family protein